MLKGRVIEVQRIHISVTLESGETVLATVRGDFHESGEYPKVGDYVQVTLIDSSEEAQAVIEEILPRRTVITRLDQETQLPQVLVTNVDVVFIVMGLDGDFNISRLERYLALANQSDIEAVIILNKADITDDLEEQLRLVALSAGDTPVYTTVAKAGEGLETILTHLTPDTTAVLLGSSGAGKSTITNWLLGRDTQDVQSVRQDDSRGRHTTTTRQLFTLPSGGYLIDTPGMRELSLADSETLEQDQLIARVEALAEQCQFRNCDHEKSAGCAVMAAVEAGDLEMRTLENYLKLLREREWLQDKSGSKERFAKQKSKRQSQAYAAAKKRRLMRGG